MVVSSSWRGGSWTGERTVVFNFGVEGYHTYFVGESGAWVHNCFEGGAEQALKKWNKHRDEFPEFRNAKEYVEAAREFVRSPPSGAVRYSRLRDGRTVAYDPASRRFAVTAPDGKTPSTFYRLDATKYRKPGANRNYRSNEEYISTDQGATQ